MDEQKIIFTDGACKFNNKKNISSRRMFVCIVDPQIPNHFQIRGAVKKGGSNNIAELLAVWIGIEYAFKKNYKNLLIKIDSQTIYYWIRRGAIKNMKINDPELTQKLLDRIQRIKGWFQKFEVEVVPRLENKAGIILDEKTKGKNFV